MNKMKVLAASIVAASIMMTGCANKQQTGTYVGAGIGGLACNYLARNTNDVTRLMITAGCAAAGGYIGNQIGKSLDERDRAALAASTQQALQGQSGTYNWASSHSGATASIKVGDTYQKTEQVTVKRTNLVEPVAQMERLSGQYLTLKGSNVRQGPSTQSGKVGFLPQMTEFTAMGKAGDWIMVGRRGVAVGYIYAPLVQSKASYEAALAKKAAAAAPAVAAAQAQPAQPVQVAAAAQPQINVVPEVPKVVPSMVLDNATSATQKDLGKLADDATPVQEAPVVATQTCRSIESSVKDANGKVETATTNACKQPAEDIWADA